MVCTYEDKVSIWETSFRHFLLSYSMGSVNVLTHENRIIFMMITNREEKSHNDGNKIIKLDKDSKIIKNHVFLLCLIIYRTHTVTVSLIAT